MIHLSILAFNFFLQKSNNFLEFYFRKPILLSIDIF